MIQKLLRHKDPRWTWKLMCNRWPEEFRDRVATEVSGPIGVPLMPSESLQSRGQVGRLRGDPDRLRGGRAGRKHFTCPLRPIRFGEATRSPQTAKRCNFVTCVFLFVQTDLIMGRSSAGSTAIDLVSSWSAFFGVNFSGVRGDVLL